MAQDVEVRQGGVLEGADMNALREAAKAKQEPKAEENDGISFDFGEDEAAVPTPEPPKAEDFQQPVAKQKAPSKEELGGGIVVENKKEEGPQGPIVGPLGPGSQAAADVAKTMKEMDMMTDIGRKVAIAKGQVAKPENITVEILLDKTGMKNVEFTKEEKEKMTKARKIKVVEIDDVEMKSVTATRPKATKSRTLIQKAFSKNYAPFVAVASGYLGKVRNLSSMEVVNLISINENNKGMAETLQQKASLVYSKLQEVSFGQFMNFDDFCKRTASLDMNVMLYGLIRATYPEDEDIMMNCQNPKCQHKSKTKNRQTGEFIMEPNQFKHSYKNTDILLSHKISDKLRAEMERVYDASGTKESALECSANSILNTVKSFKFGDEGEVIIDIYCPSIYDMIEKVASKISPDDYANPAAYGPAINLASFVKSIRLKNEDGKYDLFDNIKDLVEIVYQMDEAELDVLAEVIDENVLTYQYSYGFKADTVVCSHCGQAFANDVPVEIENLLFLQAQRHMTNG